MEFIRTIREKSQTKRQEEIQKQAEETICLSDFDNDMYIAYAGTPLIPVDDNWSPKEIMQELNKLRQNYINSKMKEYGLTQ